MQGRTILALIAACVMLGACGSNNSSDKSSSSSNATKPATGAKQGGNLTVLYAADVDFIDPGITYYQYGFNVAYATQRPLFSYKPDDSQNPVPDLADGDAKVSDDGKTITIKIRKGVKFSPPVSREVTSKDVKYALERGYNPNVSGEYLAYFDDVKGVP
jgi:peptide/nickel transport system substrate-binding protein